MDLQKKHEKMQGEIAAIALDLRKLAVRMLCVFSDEWDTANNYVNSLTNEALDDLRKASELLSKTAMQVDGLVTRAFDESVEMGPPIELP